MNALVIPILYSVGVVIVCGIALICIIVKKSMQAEGSDDSLRSGFRTLETYLYLGFAELIRQLFSKHTLMGILWYVGLYLLVAGFAGLIYLFLM